MKTNVLAISLLLNSSLTTALAGQPDPRFDGMWVGVETYTVPHSRSQWGHEPMRVSTVVAISDAGKTLGFLNGISLGRYEVSPKSNGNKLGFKSDVRVGRKNGTLQLSPDGNTLTETAFGILPGTPFAVTCDITATFHRQKKR
jgi:hypothetical protein